jgi:hypothetical protein
LITLPLDEEKRVPKPGSLVSGARLLMGDPREGEPNLPSRRYSLELKKSGKTFWAIWDVAKIFYTCKSCWKGIPIGSENAVVKYPNKDKRGRDHHHHCFPCLLEEVVSKADSVRKIPSSETRDKAIEKKIRESRKGRGYR